MKFSLWPFRRKKNLEDKSGATVQPPEKTELSEFEFGALTYSDLSRIEMPGAQPILGEVGEWNAQHFGQFGYQPGVLPIDDPLEISASQGIFKPMVEPGEFILHLSGLSSFNIPEIFSEENELPRFPEYLPILEDGLTDILVQPGGITEQIPGMAGIAPIISIPHPAINPLVSRHVIDEPEPSIQPVKTFFPPLQSPQDSFLGSLYHGMGINRPSSFMAILPAAESTISRSETVPLLTNLATPENILINSFNSNEYPDYSLGETRPGKLANKYSNLDNLVEFPSRPAIAETLQTEKGNLQPPSADISTSLEMQREVQKANIYRQVDNRLVDTKRQISSENEPPSLIYTEGRPDLKVNKEEKQSQVEGISGSTERIPSWIGLSPTRLENFQTTIRITEIDESIPVNRQPIQLASSLPNLILRQSRPPEEMVMSVPVVDEEFEYGQHELSSTPLSAVNSLAWQELNYPGGHNNENASLIEGIRLPVREMSGRENPVRNILQTIGFGYNPPAFLQRSPLVSGLDSTDESASRFTLSRQIPGMSIIENRARNAVGEVNQEMQTVQSEGMPLINQGVNSGNEMGLGGGLPQMPLPLTIGETLPSLNTVTGSIGQNIPELAEKAAPKIEKPEIPQMPSIDRLTDQIWQQIQRRLQIERERSKGMA